MLTGNIMESFFEMFQENLTFFAEHTSFLVILVISVLGFIFYFLPSIVAIYRGHQAWMVLVLNFFLWFTLIWRVIALAIASWDKSNESQENISSSDWQ